MEFFRKIAAGLVKHDINQFVGEQGNIFFSIETGEFRLSDGITPGGIPLGQGGGSGFTLLPARSDRLGGVKIGANVNVGLDGTISVAAPFSGDYNDLAGRPDLSGFQLKSTAFSGNYDELTNKPTIPTVPTGLAAFVNDVGYVRDNQLKTVAFTGSYNDLTNKPAAPVIPTNLSQFVNDTNFITTSAITWNNLQGKPSWSTVAFSGNYYDLRNLPTIPTVPTSLSSFTNDLGFVTSSGLTWDNVTGKPTFANVAYTGSYNDLSNKPFIPTDLSDLGDKNDLIGILLPDQLGSGGKFLTTNGYGQLSWATMTGGGTNITDINQLTDHDGLLTNIDLSAVAQNIVPLDTNTYSLGTSTKKWKDLYISNELWVGNSKISITNNQLTFTAPGGINFGANGITFGDGTTQTTAFTGTALTTLGLRGSTGTTGQVGSNDVLSFSSTNGVRTIVTGSNVSIDTPQDLRPTASPVFNTVNVTNISFADGTTQSTAGSGGGSGGSTTGVIKTFNIIGQFAAPLAGTAVYVPFDNTTIRSIQLVNSQMVFAQLQVGLYKNGLLLGVYSIVPGNITAKYTALDMPITTQDQLTVSVLTGQGTNFSMVLSSTF